MTESFDEPITTDQALQGEYDDLGITRQSIEMNYGDGTREPFDAFTLLQEMREDKRFHVLDSHRELRRYAERCLVALDIAMAAMKADPAAQAQEILRLRRQLAELNHDLNTTIALATKLADATFQPADADQITHDQAIELVEEMEDISRGPDPHAQQLLRYIEQCRNRGGR